MIVRVGLCPDDVTNTLPSLTSTLSRSWPRLAAAKEDADGRGLGDGPRRAAQLEVAAPQVGQPHRLAGGRVGDEEVLDRLRRCPTSVAVQAGGRDAEAVREPVEHQVAAHLVA